MTPDFSSLHNRNETAVFEAIGELAPRYPAIGQDPGLLADVACVALNRLPPRYIRHTVDFSFYQSDRERVEQAREVRAAVRHAFEFVQARALMGARS
ncbi:late competence development ComFB family protein [Calidifontimicrobium sp. SYSU G02091]|uniref:late competence development ComFB family protein n=1 Tax=Calidifontimicrobium sp. SYSU G02091 TaxID=2926421 RepID=UPI001F539285|nr:late competence development ComFB family protein [Calidifontimicrobium sp. SYSU G02091]MCI1191386.1 late competence development ComFB family protein [Calidifontimicrobium sp. SYSU G02091]